MHAFRCRRNARDISRTSYLSMRESVGVLGAQVTVRIATPDAGRDSRYVLTDVRTGSFKNGRDTYGMVAGAQKCESDELWYNCDDSRCQAKRTCSSNPGLGDCACPAFEIPGAQRCAADGLFYNCNDARCDGQRTCASDPGVSSCACPTWSADKPGHNNVLAWLPTYATLSFAVRDCSTIAAPNQDMYVLSGAQQCEGDGLWYNRNDTRCTSERICTTNSGLYSFACPQLNPIDKCAVLPVPVLAPLP